MGGAVGAVVTVGTFDGVHLGHQKVVATVVRKSREIGAASVVVTFEPHPQEVLTPGRHLPQLTTYEEKADLLDGLGVDYLIRLPFDRKFAALEADEFLRTIIVDGLKASEIVVGHDHHFGRGRGGSPKTIGKLCHQLGLGFTVVGPVSVDGVRISSTRIRDAVSDGRCEEAARMLGRWYSFSGVVTSGRKRGRDLAYPTANLVLDSPYKLIPRSGVYAIEVEVEGGRYQGLLYIGTCPTFGEHEPKVEVHILRFSGELYHQRLCVACVVRLRDEAAFAEPLELKRQIDQDVAEAQRIIVNDER